MNKKFKAFQKAYAPFRDKHDWYNAPRFGFQAELINIKYNYILEIGDAVPSTKQARKLAEFMFHGFKVLYVVYDATLPLNSEQSIKDALSEIFKRRQLPKTVVHFKDATIGIDFKYEYTPK